jgi:hypothetical protein
MRNAGSRLFRGLAATLVVVALTLSAPAGSAAPPLGAAATVGVVEITTSTYLAPNEGFCLYARFTGTLVFSGKVFAGHAELGERTTYPWSGDHCTGVSYFEGPFPGTSPTWNVIQDLPLRGPNLSGFCDVSWAGNFGSPAYIDCDASVGGVAGARRIVAAPGSRTYCPCKGYAHESRLYRGVA